MGLKIVFPVAEIMGIVTAIFAVSFNEANALVEILADIVMKQEEVEEVESHTEQAHMAEPILTVAVVVLADIRVVQVEACATHFREVNANEEAHVDIATTVRGDPAMKAVRHVVVQVEFVMRFKEVNVIGAIVVAILMTHRQVPRASVVLEEFALISNEDNVTVEILVDTHMMLQ